MKRLNKHQQVPLRQIQDRGGKSTREGARRGVDQRERMKRGSGMNPLFDIVLLLSA